VLRGVQRRGSGAGVRVVVVILFAVLAVLALRADTGYSAGPAAADKELPLHREGTVLVAFYQGTSKRRQQAIVAAAGAVETRRVGADVHVLWVGSGRVSRAIELLRANPEVRYAEPDFAQTLDAESLPDDTNVGIQWAVQNTGQMVNGVSGTPGADEKSPFAWNITTGTSSVVVAILDTGVQYSHLDLLTNMWNNPGGIGGCPAGTHGYDVIDKFIYN